MHSFPHLFEYHSLLSLYIVIQNIPSQYELIRYADMHISTRGPSKSSKRLIVVILSDRVQFTVFLQKWNANNRTVWQTLKEHTIIFCHLRCVWKPQNIIISLGGRFIFWKLIEFIVITVPTFWFHARHLLQYIHSFGPTSNVYNWQPLLVYWSWKGQPCTPHGHVSLSIAFPNRCEYIPVDWCLKHCTTTCEDWKDLYNYK